MKGHYEYFVYSVQDNDNGSLNPRKLQEDLNTMGKQGWHVVAAYSNELGKTSQLTGFGGFSNSTNATIEQNIIIFERFIEEEDYEDFLPEI